MLERLEIADWLFGHAELYDEAASQYRNRNISAELEILASDCRNAALIIIRGDRPLRS
jgi:hypothetical protein